jgi:hypothetical protein
MSTITVSTRRLLAWFRIVTPEAKGTGNMKSVSKAKVAVLAAVLVAAVASVAAAATTRSTSGRQVAYFLYCGGIICVPTSVVGEATVTATHYPSGTSKRITRIEQTMSLYYARNHPCKFGVGITTEVYADRGAYRVTTVYVAQRGSYWIDSNTVFYGGYTDLNLTVRNPRLRGRGFAAPGAGATCLGFKNFDWTFDLY